MATALTLINDALNDLEVKSAEVDLTTDEIATGIRYLNRLMVTFAAGGLNVGFTKVVNQTDESGIPDWFEDAVVTHLAIRLAPSFGVQINPAIVVAAKAAISLATKRIVHLHPVALPSTMPIGSGNYQGDNTRFFLDGTDDELEAGNGQALSDDESVNLTID